MIHKSGFKRFARPRPLRAIVLDNDETTGFYPHLELIRRLTTEPAVVAEQLTATRAFRPGLLAFLRAILRLRKRGRIDAVIMYTNMLSPQTADLLSDVFDYLVGEPFFDLLVVRKGTVAPQKYLHFVLDEYGARRTDMSKIVFFDDLPHYILYPIASPSKRPHIYEMPEYTWWSKSQSLLKEIQYIQYMYDGISPRK